MRVTVTAPAKINLSLDVTGRRDDGYHLLESVMQAVDLCDRVTVWQTADGGIDLSLSDERIPADGTNTAARAAVAFYTATNMANPGIAIRIRKRIPAQAGLAGGSADAAAVLVALNELTDSRLETADLCEIGAKVGADVPFCVLGGAAFCEGTGTILTPLTSMPLCHLVIAKPPCGVSTAEAYRRLDAAPPERRPHTSVMVDAVCAGDLDAIGRELANVFEDALGLPETAFARAVMRRHHTLGCAMSGSGSAVFGLFRERDDAQACAAELQGKWDQVFLCQPCPAGPRLEKNGLFTE